VDVPLGVGPIFTDEGEDALAIIVEAIGFPEANRKGLASLLVDLDGDFDVGFEPLSERDEAVGAV